MCGIGPRQLTKSVGLAGILLLLGWDLLVADASDHFQAKPGRTGLQTRQLTFFGITSLGPVHVLGRSVGGFLRATNTGTESVTITAVDFVGDAEFSITGMSVPFDLPPGGIRVWTVDFHPDQPGERFASLTVTSDAEGSPHTYEFTAESVDVPLGPWDWEFVGQPLGSREVTGIHVHPENDDTWYVTSIGDGLYITRDGGETWEKPLTGVGLNNEGFQIHPADPGRVIAAVGQNLYDSSDEGRTWALIETFPQWIRSILVSESDGSIYISPQWSDESSPGVYKSRDDGATWTLKPFGTSQTGLLPWDMEEDPLNGTIYITTEISLPFRPEPYVPFILRSFDAGETWETRPTPSWHAIRLQVDSEQSLYLLEEGPGLSRSIDSGDNWRLITSQFFADVLVDKNNSNRIYGGNHTVSGSTGGAFFSGNSGRNFEQVGLSELLVGGLALNGSGTKLYVASYGAGIFVASIPAVTEAVALRLPPDGATGLSAFAAFEWESTTGADVYHLQVGRDSQFSSIVIEDSNLVGTSYTVPTPLDYSALYYWRVRGGYSQQTVGKSMEFGPWSETRSFTVAVGTVLSDDSPFPQVYALHHNYPNPFKTTTSISYDLPKASRVQLAIYDLLGRKVTTLVDRRQRAGRHTADWRAEEYGSGLFIYQISAGDFVKAGVMHRLR